MSTQYSMFKFGVKILGVKQATHLPEQKLIRMSRKLQRRAPFRLPQDGRGYHYTDHLILGQYHCIQVCCTGKRTGRALLYLYGGGMMTPPQARYLEYAKKLGRQTGRDVWYAYYPLCADHSILEAVQMVHAVYEKMLAEYAPEDIAFYGFSSGGGLLTYLLLYQRELASPLPSPGKLVLVSPGSCPADEAEYQAMLALNDRDIEIDARYMQRMRPLLAHGQPVPEYMLTGEGGDYSAFPETWIFFGSEEILSVKAAAYERHLAGAGVPHHITVRNGMCHCYCIDVKFPEAQEDYDAIVRLLS